MNVLLFHFCPAVRVLTAGQKLRGLFYLLLLYFSPERRKLQPTKPEIGGQKRLVAVILFSPADKDTGGIAERFGRTSGHSGKLPDKILAFSIAALFRRFGNAYVALHEQVCGIQHAAPDTVLVETHAEARLVPAVEIIMVETEGSGGLFCGVG